jgi:hypothetical protein
MCVDDTELLMILSICIKLDHFFRLLYNIYAARRLILYIQYSTNKCSTQAIKCYNDSSIVLAHFWRNITIGKGAHRTPSFIKSKNLQQNIIYKALNMYSWITVALNWREMNTFTYQNLLLSVLIYWSIKAPLTILQ